MTEKARIKIAALMTALFLGAVSAAGVAVHNNKPQTAPRSQIPTATYGAPHPASPPPESQERERHD
jgi:hypothetical protein